MQSFLVQAQTTMKFDRCCPLADDAAAEYDKIIQENKITKMTKEQDVKYKTRELRPLHRRNMTSSRPTPEEAAVHMRGSWLPRRRRLRL